MFNEVEVKDDVVNRVLKFYVMCIYLSRQVCDWSLVMLKVADAINNNPDVFNDLDFVSPLNSAKVDMQQLVRDFELFKRKFTESELDDINDKILAEIDKELAYIDILGVGCLWDILLDDVIAEFREMGYLMYEVCLPDCEPLIYCLVSATEANIEQMRDAVLKRESFCFGAILEVYGDDISTELLQQFWDTDLDEIKESFWLPTSNSLREKVWTTLFTYELCISDLYD